MKLEHRSEVDGLCIRFAHGQIVANEEVAPEVVMGLDAEGRIVAVEFLSIGQGLAPGSLPVVAE